MQRYVGAQGVGIITKGLTEYEVRGKSILITLLRSVGVISNPHNPARSTPAGPPIEVPDAQQLGENTAEFSIGFLRLKIIKNTLTKFTRRLAYNSEQAARTCKQNRVSRH